MSVLAFAARGLPVGIVTRQPLGMAQLSPVGLSEQWMLRFCGDRHWALIARALGLSAAVFTAADGRPVYAAFCTTSLRFFGGAAPLLGREVEISSSLHAVTETRTASRHRLMVEGTLIAELSMISTFVSHDDSGANTRIFRNSVLGEMRLPQADAGLMTMDRRARETARALRGTVPSGVRVHAERPTPAVDFNAVGLLYFPSFSRIAETAAFARTGRTVPVRRRDVVYLGNIDPGETVHVFDEGPLALMTRDDGSLIAAVRSKAWGA